MAHRAKGIGIGRAHNICEQSQRIRTTLVDQGAPFHLDSEKIGVLGHGFGGASQGFPRQDELLVVG